MINRGYQADIPKWPDGKKIAVLIAFDIDAMTMWYTHAEPFNNSITDLSRGEYGPKQGVPRILDMLDKHQIKATFFVPGIVAETYPDLIREVADRGHEIAYHGYLHEEALNITEAEEHAIMVKSEKIISDITGKKLTGHRGPGGVIHDYSIRLFQQHGYIHSSNWRDVDGPFIHRINGHKVPVVELPKDSIFDDTAYDFYTETPPERYGLRSPEEMFEIWKDEFDALREEGRMMNFVMHPQFMGKASRVKMLSNLIEYMKEHDAWFATNTEAARHVLLSNGFTEPSQGSPWCGPSED